MAGELDFCLGLSSSSLDLALALSNSCCISLATHPLAIKYLPYSFKRFCKTIVSEQMRLIPTAMLLLLLTGWAQTLEMWPYIIYRVATKKMASFIGLA